MKAIAFLLFFVLSTHLHASPKLSATLSFEGIAYELQSGEIAYKEQHFISLDERGQYQSSHVVYTDQSGNKFANKLLVFSDNVMTPEVDFEDSRVGTTVVVKKQNNALDVRYKSFDDEAINVIEPVEMMVVDAGFDQMLIQYWEVLLAGNELEFEFLAPTRAQLISFRLSPITQDETTIQFVLAPNNFILRLLFEPIKLTYDKTSKRILIYEGLTNIEKLQGNKPSGQYYEARIEYHY